MLKICRRTRGCLIVGSRWRLFGYTPPSLPPNTEPTDPGPLSQAPGSAVKRYVNQFPSVNIVVATLKAGHVLCTLLVGVIAFNLAVVADKDPMLKTQRADLHSDDCSAPDVIILTQ